MIDKIDIISKITTIMPRFCFEKMYVVNGAITYEESHVAYTMN